MSGTPSPSTSAPPSTDAPERSPLNSPRRLARAREAAVPSAVMGPCKTNVFPMSVASRWIEGVAARLRQEIADHEEAMKPTAEMTRYARLSMEYGVDMLRLRARFLDRVLGAIDSGSKSEEAEATGPGEPVSSQVRALPN